MFSLSVQKNLETYQFYFWL